MKDRFNLCGLAKWCFCARSIFSMKFLEFASKAIKFLSTEMVVQ